MASDRFLLRVSVQIEHQDERGISWGGERLSVTDEAHIAAADFLELAAILGQFHALTQGIREGQSAG